MWIGLGTALLTALIDRARDAGVTRLTGLILADNTAIKRLLDRVVGPYEQRFAGEGAIEVRVDLRPAGGG